MNASYKHCNYVSMKANVCLISWHGEIHYQISLDRLKLLTVETINSEKEY